MSEEGKNIVTVKDGFAARDRASAKAGDITRQLGLAGIAIIWVFRTTEGTRQMVPRQLFPAGLILVIGLTLDLLQYVVRTATWQFVTKRSQKARQDRFETPDWINWPTWFLFIAKVTAIGIAYILLVLYFMKNPVFGG